MKKALLYGTMIALAGPVFALSAGDLVITEIMQNPNMVSDGTGEWFEIYNASAVEINLNGLTFADDGSDDFIVDVDVFVAPGAYAVLALNGDPLVNGGLTADYDYNGMSLGNSDDEIVILDGTTEIDRVNWDNGATFPDPAGKSMALADPSLDNNVGSNWREYDEATYGDGDYGTPGAQNFAIANLPPYISDVTLNPAMPGVGEDVYVYPTVTDADGVVAWVTMTWFSNTGEDGEIDFSDADGDGIWTPEAPIDGQVACANVVYIIQAADDGDELVQYTGEYTVECLTSIFDIQYTEDLDGRSPLEGQVVTTQGVVTALKYNTIFIQEANAAWSGIQVFGADNSGLSIGDFIHVSGTVYEWANSGCYTTELTNPTWELMTEPAPFTPDVILVSVSEAIGYAWESVLIRIEDVQCANADAGYGMWEVTDGISSIMVDDDFFTYGIQSVGDCFNIEGLGLLLLWRCKDSSP